MRRLQRQQQMAALKKIPVKVMIPDEISVGELASRMKRTAADVIKGLIKLGVMASISEVIDYDTAAIVAGGNGLQGREGSSRYHRGAAVRRARGQGRGASAPRSGRCRYGSR